MDSWIHPGLIFIFGALLIPLLPGRLRQIYLLVLPALAFWDVLTMTPGVYGSFNYLGFDIVIGRVDKLSLVFAHVFTLMAILGFLYGLHVKDLGQQMAACFYIGGSLGVTFAGDYLTVFIFWEMMAFGSVFLIWLRRLPPSISAGYHYLLWHIFGGLLLLAGMVLNYQRPGSMAFILIPEAGRGAAQYLILAGFALNAAVFPVHLAARRLSAGHGDRRRLYVRLHHQRPSMCWPGPFPATRCWPSWARP